MKTRRSSSYPRVWAAVRWLPALGLFLARGSVWASVAAAAAGWQFAQLARAPRQQRYKFVPSMDAAGAAILAQAAVVSLLLHHPFIAAVFSANAAALAARWSRKQGASSFRRLPANAAIALALTLAALLTLPRHGIGIGDQDAQRAAATDPLNGVYKGIILLPEPAPHPLVIPPLPSLRQSLFDDRRPNPFSVPFYGVYWMFRRPQMQPPPGSYVIKGNPLTRGFRSSDRFPLEMQARQNFGRLIDTDCCSKIQVALSSSDPNSGTIALELILTNTSVPGRPSRSLGRIMIGPAIDLASALLGVPSRGVLTFDMPRRGDLRGFELREFDEVTIVFHRAIRFESARVAVDGFVFVPKGLL